jgi:hypothetical protein
MARSSLWIAGLTFTSAALVVACAAPATVATREPDAGSTITIRNPEATIPDGVAIALALTAFKDGFRMCSRPGPSGVTSYWQVAAEEVQRVDAALLAYLRDAPGEQTLAYRPEKFVRQYAGFSRMERQFIYINAFPSDHLQQMTEDPSQTLAIGCDGGDIFWGIEFDVQRRAFAELETNGALLP